MILWVITVIGNHTPQSEAASPAGKSSAYASIIDRMNTFGCFLAVASCCQAANQERWLSEPGRLSASFSHNAVNKHVKYEMHIRDLILLAPE